MLRKIRCLLAAFLAIAVCLGVLQPLETKVYAQGSTNTVTLIYSAGDGTGDNAISDTVDMSTTVTSEAISFEVASNLAKMENGSTWTAPAGKTFKYWLANDMNLTQYYPGDAIPLDGSVTMLTAIYDSTPAANMVTLTYSVGEGTGDNAVSDPVAQSTTVTSEAITFDVASEWSKMMGGSTWTAPAGKTFKYWLANDMNLTQYYPGDAIPLDGSVTMLTAIYEDSSAAKTVTLTYSVGEGTGD
jgi:hypothetical protein